MTTTPTRTHYPEREAERLTALYNLDVLDRPLAAELEPLVRLAIKITGATTAVVNLIDRDRQWQPCAIGMDAGEFAREDAMCALTIIERKTVHTRDASLDPRLVNNPFVDGRIGNVRMYASAPLFSDGQAIGTLCVVDESAFELDEGDLAALEDLAAQVVAIFELRRQASAIARANADLEAFAGMLTHDLRNPLASARGFAEMLADDLDAANTRQVMMADRLTRSLSRMEQLISDTLNYSRNNQGEQFLTAVNVSEALQVSIENLNKLLDDTNAKIKIGTLPFVFGDALQLSQLLQNLIANGIVHSDKDIPEIFVGGEINGRGFRVVVEDNGPGIAEQLQQTIFEPFQRGETTASGTGLGLATCQRIVERHHGTLTVETSERLGGARFVIDLPDQTLDDNRTRHYD